MGSHFHVTIAAAGGSACAQALTYPQAVTWTSADPGHAGFQEGDGWRRGTLLELGRKEGTLPPTKTSGAALLEGPSLLLLTWSRWDAAVRDLPGTAGLRRMERVGLAAALPALRSCPQLSEAVHHVVCR